MIELPRDVRARLPDDFDPAEATACLSLTGGLSEAHVVAAPDRLLGFVKTSAIGGLERVELDPTDPPTVEVVQWQPSLVLCGRDGQRYPIALPTMGQARTRAQIAALYDALGADHHLHALYLDALADTRRRDDIITLRRALGALCEEIDPPEAVEHYAALVEVDPRDPEAAAGLARLHAAGHAAAAEPLDASARARGDWPAAHALAAARAGDDPDAWVAVADLARRRLDDPDAEIDALARSLALRHAAPLLDRLERCAAATGRWARYADALTAAAAAPDAPAVELWRRVAHTRRDRLADPAGALAAFEHIHQLDPADVEALDALAAAHRAAGRWGPFLYAARRALDLTDDLARKIALLRAIAAVEHDPCEREDAAIAAYTELLRLAPGDVAALDALEALYLDAERHADLIELLARRQAVAEAAMDPEAALRLLRRRAALADEQLGDVERAIDLYRQLQLRAPDDPAPRVHLERLLTAAERWPALAALLDGWIDRLDAPELRAPLRRRRARLQDAHFDDPDRALALWQALLDDLDTPDREALDAVLALHRARGDRLAIIDTLRALAPIVADPDAALALHVELARHLAATPGAEPEAITAWRRVRDLDPTHRDALGALVELHLRLDQPREAIGLLRVDARLDDEAGLDPSPTLRRLAALYADIEQPDDAYGAWVDVLARHPDDADAFAWLEAYYTAAGAVPELIALRRGALDRETDPTRLADHALAIFALHLDRQGDPAAALAALENAPATAWSDPRLVPAAHRAIDKGADGLGFLERIDAADARAQNHTRLDAARALADGLVRVYRKDPAAARLAAWLDTHDRPERAADAWQAALADPTDPDAWYGIARSHQRARRWRMLAAHLDAMSRAPLPRATRADALRRQADVLRTHLDAPDEAAAAATRADALSRQRAPLPFRLFAAGILVLFLAEVMLLILGRSLF